MVHCVSLHTTTTVQYCAKTRNCAIFSRIMQLSNIVHNSAVLQYFAETHPATQSNPILKVQAKENCACSPEIVRLCSPEIVRTLSIVPLAHHCGSSGISCLVRIIISARLFTSSRRVSIVPSLSHLGPIAKETQRKPKLLYKNFLALHLCFTEREMFFVLFLGFVNSLFCSA